jgi:hypothetical protein
MKKLIYQAPTIEIIEVVIEQGFALSNDEAGANFGIEDWGPSQNFGGDAE